MQMGRQKIAAAFYALPPAMAIAPERQKVRQRDYLVLVASGRGRVGLTFEHFLNNPKNNAKVADIMGIEHKAKCDNGTNDLIPHPSVLCQYMGKVSSVAT